VLTPDGRTSRYFFGFEYKPRDLRLAIFEASEGKIGSVADQLLLLCFHYDPKIGKYSRDAMIFARAGGVTTVLALGGFIFIMIRKERPSPGASRHPLPAARGEGHSGDAGFESPSPRLRGEGARRTDEGLE